MPGTTIWTVRFASAEMGHPHYKQFATYESASAFSAWWNSRGCNYAAEMLNR